MSGVGHSRFKGILCALLGGLILVLGLALFPDNRTVALVVVLIIPFFLGLVLTGSKFYALLIVWLNELIFGVSGAWISIGPVPGRGLLLVFVLAVVLINRNVAHIFLEFPRRMHQIIFFYGIGYPVILVTWGVVFREAQFSHAVADVLRFVGILGIYPVYLFMRTNYQFGKMWLLTSVSLLSGIFVIGSLGTYDIKTMLVENWIYLGRVPPEVKINYLRLSYEPMIYGYVGIFYGLTLLTSRRKKSWTIGITAIVLNLAPTVVNFLRGPLGAIYLSIMWFVFGSVRQKGSFLKLLKLLPIFAAVLVVSIYLILTNPVAQNKIQQLRYADNISDYLSSDRVVQSKIMMDAWREAPVFGVGVGTPLQGYKSSGLSVELQYLMILYRTGVVGLLLIVAPLLVLARNLIVTSRRSQVKHSYEDIDDMEKSVGHTILALAVASFFNPYLASSVTVTLLCFYYGLRQLKSLAMLRK